MEEVLLRVLWDTSDKDAAYVVVSAKVSDDVNVEQQISARDERDWYRLRDGVIRLRHTSDQCGRIEDLFHQC